MGSQLRAYGEWAVVTGASEGIGRAFAECVARAGVKPILVARRRERLEALAGELEQRWGVESDVLVADLATPAGLGLVVEGTRDRDVGLLVAAAGFGTSGAFVESNLAEELAMIDVNCRTVAALAHHFGGRFVARGRGGIVLLSSLLAFQGVPRAANYAATKAYVQSLAEGLRAELAPRGVHVVASAPGPIHSGFATRADMRMSMTQAPSSVAQATLDALGRRTTVRPGWLSKALEASLSTLPRALRVVALAQVMRGMTKHQAGVRALPERSA